MKNVTIYFNFDLARDSIHSMPNKQLIIDRTKTIEQILLLCLKRKGEKLDKCRRRRRRVLTESIDSMMTVQNSILFSSWLLFHVHTDHVQRISSVMDTLRLNLIRKSFSFHPIRAETP